MNDNMVADILLGTVPYAMWLKATVFFVVLMVMVASQTLTILGRWINAFFLATFVTSVNIALFTERILDPVVGSEVNNPFDWYLLIAMNVSPIMLSIAGIMVGHYARTLDPKLKIVIEAEERQRTQQGILDETSLILAKRGKVISEAGIALDNRSIQMNKDQREYDASHPADTIPADSESGQGPRS